MDFDVLRPTTGAADDAELLARGDTRWFDDVGAAQVSIVVLAPIVAEQQQRRPAELVVGRYDTTRDDRDYWSVLEIIEGRHTGAKVRRRQDIEGIAAIPMVVGPGHIPDIAGDGEGVGTGRREEHLSTRERASGDEKHKSRRNGGQTRGELHATSFGIFPRKPQCSAAIYRADVSHEIRRTHRKLNGVVGPIVNTDSVIVQDIMAVEAQQIVVAEHDAERLLNAGE